MKKLETIIMVKTDITNVSRSTFQGLTALERLEIQGDHFHIIPPGTFEGLQKLTLLRLKDSPLLTCIPERPVVMQVSFTYERSDRGNDRERDRERDKEIEIEIERAREV